VEPAASAVPKLPLRLCKAAFHRMMFLLLAGVFALGAAAWFARRPLLCGAANIWIVSDPVQSADAVAVFGGGVADRPFAAASYFKEGLVKKILLSNDSVGPAAELDAIRSDTAANRNVLRKLGVPESAIETFGYQSSNTYEEAVALRAWAAQAGAHRLIVPTEMFSARRVRWILRRIFGGKVKVFVPALVPAAYNRDNWCRHKGTAVALLNEFMKYAFYRLKY